MPQYLGPSEPLPALAGIEIQLGAAVPLQCSEPLRLDDVEAPASLLRQGGCTHPVALVAAAVVAVVAAVVAAALQRYHQAVGCGKTDLHAMRCLLDN